MTGVDLQQARALAREKTEKDTTFRHLVSVEGVMRALARRFEEDEDRWALEHQQKRSNLIRAWPSALLA